MSLICGGQYVYMYIVEPTRSIRHEGVFACMGNHFWPIVA